MKKLQRLICMITTTIQQKQTLMMPTVHEQIHEVTSGTATAAEVKMTAALGKTAIELGKASKTAEGRVCANKKFKKIVIYIYKNDSDGNRIGETITTYTKK